MKHRITWKFAFMQTLYWSSCTIVYSFGEHLLRSVGFRTDQIGIILAATHIAAILLQPLLASAADRTRGPSLRAIILGCVSCVVLAAVGMLFFEALPQLFALSFAVLSAVSLAVQPLLNTVGFVYINRGEPLDFSFGRGIASVGYAAFVYIFGRLADLGNHALMYVFIGMQAALFLFIIYFSPKRQAQRSEGEHRQEPKKLTELMKAHPHFWLILFGTLFLFMSHNFLNSYMLSIVSTLGGDTTEMSNAISVAAWLEVPTMLLFGVFQKRFRVEKLLRFSVIAFSVKMLLTWLTVYLDGQMLYLYLVQTLQALGYALFVPASSYYANLVMGEADSAKAQMLITASTSCGCVLSLVCGGFGIEYLGVKVMLLVSVIAAVLGLISVFVGTGLYQRNKRKGLEQA